MMKGRKEKKKLKNHLFLKQQLHQLLLFRAKILILLYLRKLIDLN